MLIRIQRIIIIWIIIYAINHIKTFLLYHPIKASINKYLRFYQKLLELVEAKEYLVLDQVKTIDNFLLDTIYLRNPNSNKCIVCFHGNAGNVAMRYDLIKFLYTYCSVLIFDYRSFGKSSGSITDLSCQSLLTDAQAVWQYVTRILRFDSRNISVFGESLGCAIAINLVTHLSETMDEHNYPHSLILNSPFYSLGSLLACNFGTVSEFVSGFLNLFLQTEYRSDIQIQFINHLTKVIIAHSVWDEVIPYNEALKLYQILVTVRSDVKFVDILGTHNNLIITDHYIYALAALFNE